MIPTCLGYLLHKSSHFLGPQNDPVNVPETDFSCYMEMLVRALLTHDLVPGNGIHVMTIGF